MGRTPEPLGLKILKGRSATKDIAGQPIPTPPAFERGVPDCPAWLSPGAKEVWEAYAPMLDDVASIKVADAWFCGVMRDRDVVCCCGSGGFGAR